MAGVATTLTLQDRMTNTINRQVSAVDRLIGKFKKIDSVTENLNPGAAMRDSIPEINRAQGAVEDLNRSQQNTARGADKIKNSWGGVGGAIKAALAALGAKKAFDLTMGAGLDLDAMEREFQARLGNDQVGSALFAKLQKQAEVSAFSLDDLAKNTSSFLAMTTDPKQLDGLNRIAEKLAVFDKTGQGLAGAGFSLKEAMSGDIVSLAERFNMSKAQIRALNIDKLGKTGNIEEFITQFEKLLEMQNMGEDAYQKMRQAPKTQLNMFASNVKTGFAKASQAAVDALLPLITMFNDWFNSDSSQQFFNAIGAGLETAVNAVTWAVTAIRNNWDTLKPILMVGLAAVIALTLQWAAVSLASGLMAAGAFLIAHWPILLIGAAIGLLILLLSKMGVTADQVCGFVGGVFGGLYSVIYNIVAAIWNAVASFVEFFANCFNHPIYTIKRLFVNLADTVLDIVKRIAEAIDFVFGSNLAGSITTLQDNMQAWLGEKPEGYKVIQRLESKSIPETVMNGYSMGTDFANGVEDMLKNFSMGGKVDTSAWDNFDGKISNVGLVDEVGKIKDDVNIADEDLQLLRDVAEMRYTQNLVTLTPQVHMTATISEKVDVDEVVGEMERRLEDEFVAAAEGVYS